MYKLILSFYIAILSTNLLAGSYDEQIQQAMKECDIERSMTQSSFHDNGSACERVQQLIELQKSENNQTQNQNVNVHIEDDNE
ncbi:hypothetical protein Lche_3255 [Legionella cherrii]|uniref:Secreted protein n=1 Tax=Legionella cherrii TaxID=28084 RepID=A0A0W0S534_9GAMM|nr:hypothetical protein [Legionella cherrii]KTC78466.1 hypothetical protein Lche_3255 [Legionella cherrii]